MTRKYHQSTKEPNLMNDKATLSQQQIMDRINNALNSNIPHIYFNGYINTSSGEDILVVLEVVGRPVGTLHMSTAGAKGFAAALLQTVTQHENATQKVETKQ